MFATVRDSSAKRSSSRASTDSAIHQLAKVVTAVTYEADAVLFDEGSPRDFMSIIVSGAVAIEKGMNGRPVRLVTLGAGQAVGEGLLLDELAARHERARAAAHRGVRAHDRPGARDGEGAADAVRGARRARGAVDLAAARRDRRDARRDIGRTLGFAGSRTRDEHDLLGDREVPDEALYGVQTLRALENFPITGIAAARISRR